MFVRLVNRGLGRVINDASAADIALRILAHSFPGVPTKYLPPRIYVEVPDHLTELELETCIAIMQRALFEQEAIFAKQD